MMPNCQVSCYVLFGFHYIVCGTLTLQRKGTKADVETGKGDNTKAFDLFSSRIGKEEIFFIIAFNLNYIISLTPS